MATGTQFKTGTIVLNETLMGFEDTFEFLDRVNHDYQEMIANDAGMPTGGSISVRTMGYKAPQTGQTFTKSSFSQQYETIAVDTSLMLGDWFALNPVEFETDRIRATDSMHYGTASTIATQANIACYRSLALNTPMSVGGSSQASIDYDLLANLQASIREMEIPMMNSTLFTNTRDYAGLSKSILAAPVPYDQPLVSSANKYVVGSYAGFDIAQSSTLYVVNHTTPGTAAGKTLTFTSVVSTDSYKSAVITLTGTNGDTLVPGDRLTFATTKLIAPKTQQPTSQPLQLVVQNTVTASGGAFTGVQVVCGIQPLTTSGGINGDSFYANVLTVPANTESVVVMGAHKLNFWVPRMGFTFATVGLQNTSTIDIKSWFQSGTSKQMMAPQVRNKVNQTAPINMRTIFDMEGLATANMGMRIDMQPVYKPFQRLNFAVITAV